MKIRKEEVLSRYYTVQSSVLGQRLETTRLSRFKKFLQFMKMKSELNFDFNGFYIRHCAQSFNTNFTYNLRSCMTRSGNSIVGSQNFENELYDLFHSMESFSPISSIEFLGLINGKCLCFLATQQASFIVLTLPIVVSSSFRFDNNREGDQVVADVPSANFTILNRDKRFDYDKFLTSSEYRNSSGQNRNLMEYVAVLPVLAPEVSFGVRAGSFAIDTRTAWNEGLTWAYDPASVINYSDASRGA